MAGICRGSRGKVYEILKHFSFIFALFLFELLWSKWLGHLTTIQKTGDQTLLKETNFCVFFLNFQTFRRFCDFLQRSAKQRPYFFIKISAKAYLGMVCMRVVLHLLLEIFLFLCSKFEQNYCNMIIFLNIFDKRCT